MAPALALLALSACVGPGGPPVGLEYAASFDGTAVGADALAELEFTIARGSAEGEDWAAGLDFSVDDERAEREWVESGPDALVLRPRDLAEGERTVTVVWAPPGSSAARTLQTWTFTVDVTPPPLEVALPEPPIVVGEPLVVTGTSEVGATVSIEGADVALLVDESGTFALTLDAVPDGALVVTATDAAGNRTTVAPPVATVPSRLDLDETRGIHVTACTWDSPERREAMLELATAGAVNTFVLTVKAEDGLVGFAWPRFVEVVDPDTWARACRYDLEDTIAALHERGVKVVARIVAFRDPVLAAAAWERGDRDLVIQTPDGQPYEGYGGFLNPANAEVRDYNIALAETVAAAGADAILWDYVRRPDGPLDALVLPGLDGTVEVAVAEFVRLADERLAPYGVEHGASVYGIAATRPLEIGQDLTLMAPHLDVIAPMVYPSHWGPREYGLANPVRAPYDIILRSLEDHQRVVAGTRARIVPWLEDTPYRAWDRPRQVRDQIRATYDLGIREWYLWDPGNRYTPSAIEAPGEA